MDADGRYAPSPTGELHLGNLRTALLAWLFARSQQSRFLLRIDDLDPERSRSHWVDRQLGDLRSIGLEWDDEPIFQSRRGALYDEALAPLVADQLVYECFCTRAEIRRAASAPHAELPEGAYPGTCRELSAERRRELVASGRPPALRVRADAATIAFDDRLHGPVSGVVDDFVVRRNDGIHAYNFATVVDDAEQGVDEVVRGDDLLSSTARQLWLARELGLKAPSSFAHVPLMLGPDGKRLAKRHGAVTLRERLAGGDSFDEVRAELMTSVGLPGVGEMPAIEELLQALR